MVKCYCVVAQWLSCIGLHIPIPQLQVYSVNSVLWFRWYLWIWQLCNWESPHSVFVFCRLWGDPQAVEFVQYSFARKEHEIDIQPHGNSKKGAFQRTKPTTLKLIKASVAENKRPLKVLKEVENSQRGVMEAKLSCNLPWNRRQVYNFKSAHEAKHQKSSIPTARNASFRHICSCNKSARNHPLLVRPSYVLYKMLLNLCVF